MKKQREAGQTPDDELELEEQHKTITMKIIGPVVTFVDRPWKMYPVGVLFGFGLSPASLL